MKPIKLLAVAAVCATFAVAAEKMPMKTEADSKEFALVKGLVGTWKGTCDMGGKPTATTTTFRLTAAGSAVVETMDVGTPHEMTNVYHDVNGKLEMTHYCALGNAPQMRVVKSDADSVALEAVAANGIDPKITPHMHGLAYSFGDKNHLTATWTALNVGKEHEAPSVFSYTRVVEERPSK
jgi:hypothetical protein